MSDPILHKAKKRVERKKRFFRHAMIIVCACLFITITSFIVTPGDNLWALIPISALLASVLIHYFMVWGIPGTIKLSEDWETKQIEKEYLRLRKLEETKTNLTDKESLELKELQFKYREEDFV